MHELALRGGLVIDGRGGPPQIADVAIDGGRVSAIGDVGNAADELDARGLVVSPGFIDIHTHSDFTVFNNPLAPHAVLQGVTTEVIGNCGFSLAPISDQHLGEFEELVRPLGEGIDWTWRSFGDSLEALARARPAQNLAPLVGHGTIRTAVRGLAKGTPTTAEMATMRELVGQAMAAGFWGLSTGLIYPPGVYAAPDEVIDLAKVANRSAGLYATHMRDEGDHLMDSIEESLTVAARSGIRLQVSHLKAAARKNWGMVTTALERIEAARAEGARVYTDFYPYEAASTFLTAVLPPWVLDGGIPAMIGRLRAAESRQQIRRDMLAGVDGWWNPYRASEGWDRVIVTSVVSKKNQKYEGLTVADAAARVSQDPFDFVFDLLSEERGGALMAVFLMSAADLKTLAAYPHAAIGSDSVGVVAAGKRAHPRAYGSFVRFLGQYVRELRVLDLPEAVRRMTSLPASILGLDDRGHLSVGSAADIVVFDPDTISDQTTYVEPTRPPVGVRAVFVNGRRVANGDQLTGERPGHVLTRRPTQ
jgi:N-acyl-D-amino-acid deacylase